MYTVKTVTAHSSGSEERAIALLEDERGDKHEVPISFLAAYAAPQLIGQSVEAAALDDGRWWIESRLEGVVETVEITASYAARVSFRMEGGPFHLIARKADLFWRLLDQLGKRCTIEVHWVAGELPLILYIED